MSTVVTNTTEMHGLLVEIAGLDTVTEPESMHSYVGDEAGWLTPGDPLAVVFPHSVEEVQEVVAIAATRGVPIVPRGAGSGLSGGANAIDGSIVISMERMNRILSIDTSRRIADVEPGVITTDLKNAAIAEGLYYPPDPSSAEMSTIGGNVATNAGGLCCVRYGVTRDYVAGLDVVLADGSLARFGSIPTKSVAGYDMTSLIVGSEGTLGIVAGVRLRLIAAPDVLGTVVGFFPSMEGALETVDALLSRGQPNLVEILDQTTAEAVEQRRHLGLDVAAEATLLVQVENRLMPPVELTDLMLARGASFSAGSSDPVEANMLLEARRAALPSLEDEAGVLLDDVSVPIDQIPELCRRLQQIGIDTGARIATFGHVADGNLHPCILHDPDDLESMTAAHLAFDQIVEAALDLGGSITGEHGVGLLKRTHLKMEVGTEALSAMRAVKTALDPNGIMNPGKVL